MQTLGVTKYYFADGKRIAMRDVPIIGADTLYYTVTDHLGGASLITTDGGAEVGEVRYLPFGGRREATASIPTDKQYTGQQLEANEIYHYGARLYDADIGRFISADTIVPVARPAAPLQRRPWREPGNPQALNRYSYVLNNPLRYTDPTGNIPLDDEGANAAPAPDGGWTSGWSTIVLEGLSALGLENPQPSVFDGPDATCPANCDDLEFAWIMKTYKAARVLERLGDLDMLLWSTEQRYLLQELGFAVDWRFQRPAWMYAEYTLAAAAVAGLMSSGSTGGTASSGALVGKSQLGPFWRQFEGDFGSGKLGNWRVEVSTGSAPSRQFPGAVNTEIKITNLRTGQYTYGQMQWRLGVASNVAPFIQPVELHPRPYSKSPR